MQPEVQTREVLSRGGGFTTSFGMQAENSAHIFGILRSQLYSNKVLAVLREYSANAWDEHRAAGIPDRPIKVVVPTELEPTLRVRDYGRGLTEEQVRQTYTQYGSSTKRADNLTVGALGIGSKSAFAYTDSFTVTAWHDGQKSIYQAVLDETNVGTMSLMWRGPCDPAETGVEVSLAVSGKDCFRFLREAKSLYRFFEPRPDIGFDLPEVSQLRFPEGDLIPSLDYDGWYAVMGCIPYPIDFGQLFGGDSNVKDSLREFSRLRGVLRLNIGEVSISASREGLEYTPRTRKVLIEKFETLLGKVSEGYQVSLREPSQTSWDKRLRALGAPYFFQRLLEGKDKSLLDRRVRFPPEGKGEELPCTMRLLWPHRKGLSDFTEVVEVVPNARILLKDNKTPLQSYAIAANDRVIVPKTPEVDWDAVEVKLEELLKEAGLDGIPVERISTLPEIPKAASKKGKTPGAPTPSRKLKVFHIDEKAVLMRGDNRSAPSRNWVSVTITPSAEDVYFVLNSFRITRGGSWDFPVTEVFEDRKLMQWLGLDTFPEIIGYRNTETEPLQVDALLGKNYFDWRSETIKKLLAQNPEKAEQLRKLTLLKGGGLACSWRWQSECGGLIRALNEKLGSDHFLTQQVQGLIDAQKVISGLKPSDYEILSKLMNLMPPSRGEFDFKKYPLFHSLVGGPGPDVLLEKTRRNFWLDYIRLVDSQVSS